MKLIFLLLMAFSQVAMAQNVSSECYRLSSLHINPERAYAFCTNVADNCFIASERKLGIEGARNKCLNVASSCYRETKDPKRCVNVNNSCYRAERRYGNLTVEESIKKCFDQSF